MISNGYNDLLDVREASSRVDTPAGRAVLDQLLSRIAAHGLEDQFGIRLLHKHNDLERHEWMRERLAVDHDGPALITRAEVRQQDGATANSWQLSSMESSPVEFSDTELLVDVRSTEDAQKLFGELSAILAATEMSHVLGPCALYSETVDHLRPTDTSAFLEKTDVENRANVLRYIERAAVDFQSSVETKWSAKRSSDEHGNPIWLASCTCFCSVDPGGGHLGTTTHRYTPPPPPPPPPPHPGGE